MRLFPQFDHADLGLIDFDNTEDMRKAPAATEALQKTNYPIRSIERTAMPSLPTNPDGAAEILTETLSGLVPLNIAEPALPDGASAATGEWSGWFDPPGSSFRFVVTLEHAVGDRTVIGYVTQEEDGRCGDPKVYVDAEVGLQDGLSPADARLFAYRILAVANSVDRWTNGEPSAIGLTPAELLDIAQPVLKAAYRQLSTQAGNAYDYVLTAQEAVSNALAVLR
jgi:hypothetical protein